jgi:hypothetical protein
MAFTLSAFARNASASAAHCIALASNEDFVYIAERNWCKTKFDNISSCLPAISLPSATATRPMYSDPIVMDAVTFV